ncbi:MAG: hypothetical protein AB1646_10575 [Thermodesulfobacteriota bacterium]
MNSVAAAHSDFSSSRQAKYMDHGSTYRPLLIEVISEGPHCVPCEYAIAAVEYVCESYPEQVEVRIIETKRASDAQRYLELSRELGRLPPMPSVFIEGRLAFAGIPEPGELGSAIDAGLAASGCQG